MIELKKEEKTDIKGPYGDILLAITPCTISEGAQPVFIMAHGFRGSLEGGGRAKYLANLAGEIAHVVRFNFNGSQILSRQIEELEAVVAYVKNRFRGSKIVLLGRSMAAALRLLQPLRMPKLAAWLCGLRLMICTPRFLLLWARMDTRN